MFKMRKDINDVIYDPDKCGCNGYAGNVNSDMGDQFPHLPDTLR